METLAPPVAEPTLTRRIAFKSIGSVLALPLNLVLQALVPRALGAAAYGDYSFLSAFFTSVMTFADSGSSQAYYNKLSQTPGEAGLSAFYARFAGLILASLAALTGLAFLSGAAPLLWPTLSAELIALAALMAFGNWLIAVVGKAVDANALTGLGETAVLLVRLFLVLAVVGFFTARMLTLSTFLALQNVFNVALIVALVFVLSRRGRARAFTGRLRADQVARYTRAFWEYCHPLLTVSFAVLIVGLLDRWLLQRWAGSVQQGFLGLGLQIGAVVFIFGGATASLLAREFARAHHAEDRERLRAQFNRYLPRAYSATAYFGVFLAVQAPAVVRIFGGAEFSTAAPATAILCLYPLHQVYGQLGNSLLYATDRTKTVRGISVVGLALGLLLTIFFLAPHSNGGLGLGAIGIATKMVVQQVIVVNVILLTNARYLHIPFRSLLIPQILIPFSFASCAAASTAFVSKLSAAPVLGFILSGICYTTLVLCVGWLWPFAVGFERKDFSDVLRRLRAAT